MGPGGHSVSWTMGGGPWLVNYISVIITVHYTRSVSVCPIKEARCVGGWGFKKKKDHINMIIGQKRSHEGDYK